MTDKKAYMQMRETTYARWRIEMKELRNILEVYPDNELAIKYLVEYIPKHGKILLNKTFNT